MRINFGEKLEIQDLGNHPAATMINLAFLLSGEVNATPDPKRNDLYEIENGSTVYYVYKSPFSGTIFLIATWKKMRPLLPQWKSWRPAGTSWLERSW